MIRKWEQFLLRDIEISPSRMEDTLRVTGEYVEKSVGMEKACDRDSGSTGAIEDYAN